MSTILDALRRLQTDRTDEPAPDPRELLASRITVPKPRLTLRGVGAGALAGTLLGVLLVALWSLSSEAEAPGGPQSPPPLATSGPQGSPPVPVLGEGPGNSQPETPQEPAFPDGVRLAAEPEAPQAEPGTRSTADPGVGADSGDSPLVASPGPALPERRLERSRDLSRAADRTAPAPAPTAPGRGRDLQRAADAAAAESTPDVPRYSAVARRPPTPPGRAPAPATPRTPERPPRPAPARPQPAPPPPPSVPEPESPFPRLVVTDVRWHPDPGRREANIEVDGVVAIDAKEGDEVGGAVLSRIDPGQVEFRLGRDTRIVRVGQ